MSLLDEYAKDFDRGVKAQGEELVQSGKVTISKSEPDSVEADVSDAVVYHSTIGCNPAEGMWYSCTCPTFQEHDTLCRHLWAR